MRGLWQALQEFKWPQICKQHPRVFRASANAFFKHKQHSPPCNPELKLNSHLTAAGLGGLGVNVGLPGIGEEGML